MIDTLQDDLGNWPPVEAVIQGRVSKQQNRTSEVDRRSSFGLPAVRKDNQQNSGSDYER